MRTSLFQRPRQPSHAASVLCILLAMLGLAASGCEESKAKAKVQVERLPEVDPDLPNVPDLPPPPHSIQYDDQSYSVYGLRQRMRDTIDSKVSVTGYIAKIYEPPECEKGDTCPTPAAPHFWVADTRDEEKKDKMLLVGGYAENQEQIEEAKKKAERGRYEPPPEESGLLPIPVDLEDGAKIKVDGRFSYISGAGFHSSEGVLSYGGHEIVEAAPGSEED